MMMTRKKGKAVESGKDIVLLRDLLAPTYQDQVPAAGSLD